MEASRKPGVEKVYWEVVSVRTCVSLEVLGMGEELIEQGKQDQQRTDRQQRISKFVCSERRNGICLCFFVGIGKNVWRFQIHNIHTGEM